MKNYLLILGLAMCSAQTYAQDAVTTQQTKTLTQRVRGRVTDAESKAPLAGVVVYLVANNLLNGETDSNGYFNIDNVPVGRQSFQFHYVGYEPYVASETMIISGKELELNITLTESLTQLKEVTVSANKDKIKPLNEFATVSARSFSVEETRRYAASFADPARMVMNFPGVSNGGDQDNSIVVRGNSPRGVLWKLEGIEIPNPNHFSGLGATGGAISMLNANTLGNSDFYTGAFAPEIGNALSGAFDLNLRTGNTEKYEHTIQLGTLGVELASEGPFSKGSKASYLFNYRYSTLVLLGKFFDFGTMVPEYQDASFKVNLPTKKAGTFTLFGLGGYNDASQKAIADSSKWDEDNENITFSNIGKMGVVGASHQYFLKKDAYIRTIISASYDQFTENVDTLDVSDNYKAIPTGKQAFSNRAYRGTVIYNQKINARNTFRTGVIAHQLSYDLNSSYYSSTDKIWKRQFESEGNTQLYQAYMQWKSRLTNNLTLTGGVHGTYLALNDKYAVEPRAALAYQHNKNKWTLSAGLHSKPEHLSTYMFQNTTPGAPVTTPNKNLDLSKAIHNVAGYETNFGKLRFKTEVYYQYLYNVPVEKDMNSAFSIINAGDVYALYQTEQPLVNDGTGQNYGIDISIEKPLSNGYYAIATGSIYKSTYTDYAGREFNTMFDRGHQLNLIGGKEFKLRNSDKRIIGLNGKILWSGGMRESLIDVNKSIQDQETVIVPGEYFTQKAPAYFRADMSVYYKTNTRKATHTILLDVQNITNKDNYYFSYFDVKAGEVKRVNQLGIFPNISYRIDFHW
jgi:hypothetical protein